MNQERDNREITSKDEKDTIIRLATQEGRIFKAGASGKYQKSPLTRIGFILLGLPFLTFFLLSYMAIKDLKFANNLGEVFTPCLVAVVCFAFGLIGILMIRQAFKK
jgi:hypothetical protein